MNGDFSGTLVMVAHSEKWLYLQRKGKSYGSRVLPCVIMIDAWQIFVPLPLDLNKYMRYWPCVFMEMRKVHVQSHLCLLHLFCL